MDWLQVVTIIASLGGMIYWMRTELREDINRIDLDCKAANVRIDALQKASDDKFAILSQRLDESSSTMNKRLDDTYRILISLIKDEKKAKKSKSE